MRRGVEMMAKSTATKNGQERITTDRDSARHLEYFNNGQWRHSSKCREFTNKDCRIKIPDSSL
jgi:hypothetical protein